MEHLLKLYWRDANREKELDPLNFEIEDFTDKWMYTNRNAVRLLTNHLK
jgi:hypothetical protein